MDTFYVFVAPPRQRARIHRGSCGFCQNGEGGGQGKIEGRTTFWSQAFRSYAAANGYMRGEFSAFKDLGSCPACRPEMS